MFEHLDHTQGCAHSEEDGSFEPWHIEGVHGLCETKGRDDINSCGADCARKVDWGAAGGVVLSEASTEEIELTIS